MSPSAISILEAERKTQEWHLYTLNARVQEGYKTLRETIVERNNTITNLAQIENAIAILQANLFSEPPND